MIHPFFFYMCTHLPHIYYKQTNIIINRQTWDISIYKLKREHIPILILKVYITNSPGTYIMYNTKYTQ